MSSKDKTGDKLVASVRKSKTGTVARKTSQRSDAGEAEAKPKSTATRSALKATTNKSASTAKTSQERENNYSYGRRVWPD